jgi:D-alanyl-D-alanine carboxypeptidase
MCRLKLRASLALLIVAVMTAATASTSAAGPSGKAQPCPSGTTADDGLCVGKGAKAQQSAELVRSLFESEALGAVIVGVWKDGKPLLVGALGDSLSGVPAGTPATVDMRHRAGNIGHMMIETVLLQQVEAGTLSLDDKLSKYMPDLPSADDITIDMVAHSTSGYEQYTVVPAFQTAFYANPFQVMKIDDLIGYGVEGGPMYPPGTSWNFSDTNILILARVLEEATGQSVNSLVKKGVLDPLGMKHTTTQDSAALPRPVLHSYTGERGVWEEATFWNPSWTSFAGGWGSTQDDLRKLVEGVGTGKLVSKQSHELQLAPTSVGLGTSTADRYYGMGISVVNDWLLTAPGLQGYHGSVGYLRDQKLTVVIYFTQTPEYDVTNRSTLVFEPLSAILAPANAVSLG